MSATFKQSDADHAANGSDVPVESSSPHDDQNAELRRTLESLDLNPRRRRWPIGIAGLAVGVAATLGTLAAIDRNSSTDTETVAETAQTATAPVETRDLLEEVEWSGTLGFGEPTSLIAPNDGTLTTGAALGSALVQGDVVAVVDDLAMVLFYGDVPFYRDLSSGDQGADVRQLETNLVALGYDPDVTVTIDHDFTANTAAMVERWQEALGGEVTGSLRLGAVALTEGPATVVTSSATGNTVRSGDAVAVLDVRQVEVTVVSDGAGVVDELVSVGTTIEFGTPLFTLDEQPIVALVDPDRIGELLADSDADIETLESLLAASGFDPDDAMTVDGVITDSTRAAVGLWQEANDLPVTLIADSSGYVLVRAGLEAALPLVLPGSDLIAGRPTLALTAPKMSVVVTIAASDADEFAVGDEVDVEMADETLQPGVVTNVGTIVTPGSTNDDDPTIEVTVTLVDPDELGTSGPVTVRTISSRIDGALVVPTRALVSLVEGGFAVEKQLEDGTSVLVQVEVGTFDDGVVEVVSSQLESGDQLVVPS